jgi:hypothetical protein
VAFGAVKELRVSARIGALRRLAFQPALAPAAPCFSARIGGVAASLFRTEERGSEAADAR